MVRDACRANLMLLSEDRPRGTRRHRATKGVTHETLKGPSAPASEKLDALSVSLPCSRFHEIAREPMIDANMDIQRYFNTWESVVAPRLVLGVVGLALRGHDEQHQASLGGAHVRLAGDGAIVAELCVTRITRPE